MNLLLSNTINKVQEIKPLTKAEQNDTTNEPTLGIPAIGVLLISSPTAVPTNTLEPVAIITAEVFILSPNIRLSGLNSSTLPASTTDAYICLMLFTKFFAVVKNIFTNVVVKLANAPETKPSPNFDNISLYFCFACSTPFLYHFLQLLGYPLVRN